MKTRITILLVVISVISILLPITPVQAAASMSPGSGTVGTYVAISGLTASDSYLIKWDGTNIRSGTVPSGGSVFFTTPEASRGSHNVEVESPTGTPVLSAPFTIIPSIEITPQTGTSGTLITVIGKGFSSLEGNIWVLYDSIPVAGNIFANSFGSWVAQFIAPDSPKGFHLIDAFGSITYQGELTKQYFNIMPRITFSPSIGCVGTNVNITGTGFASNETNIIVRFGNEAVRTGIIADSNGTWSSTFTVPMSSRGSHTVDASGSSTSAFNISNGTFTVTASAFISPTVGSVGDTIEVSGRGFLQSESGITITYDGAIVKSGITADSEGTWMTTLEIPQSSSGTHEIDAYGNGTTSLNCTDTTLVVQAKINLNPAGGYVGQAISVTGTGFGSQRTVTISYGGTTVVSNITTDSKGSFSANFNAPGGRHGPISVNATDSGGATASATFSMETTPPPVPQLISPSNGERIGFIGSSQVTFDWTDVTDPSGVFYTLEISQQPDFFSPIIRKINLTESQYRLTETEALPHGDYYWRVRAIDGAANAASWTQPFLVRVSVMTVQTFIIILVIGIAVIALAVILPLALGKKK